MKRVWEKIVEGILTCSGFVTSITILLIVVFLLRLWDFLIKKS